MRYEIHAGAHWRKGLFEGNRKAFVRSERFALATRLRLRRDIGYIDNVDPNAGEIVLSFDGRSVTYGFGELDMLVPAYAATIHKSQGSEYQAVIIPVLTQH
jgi:ATP-dependent exoDNAse (exonuclease V) alpha subunit